MVGKGTLKGYELNSIYRYYEMILTSFTNGQREQAKTQAKRLSKEQRLEFLHYLPEICADNHNEVEFFERLFIIGG